MMLTRSKVVLVVVVSLQVCVMTVMLLSNIQVSSTGRLIEDGARHKHSTARDPFTVRITTDTIVAPEQGTEEMTEIMVRRLQQLRNGQMLSHVLHAESRYASPEEGSSNNSLDVQAATANLEQNSSHEGKEHQEAASSEKKRNRNLFFVKIISRDKPKTTMSESKNVRILGKVPHRISIHGSDKIFISVKYSDIHTERLLPMMLTWLQTVDGKQVIQHPCVLLGIIYSNYYHTCNVHYIIMCSCISIKLFGKIIIIVLIVIDDVAEAKFTRH